MLQAFLVSHRIWNVLPRSAALHRLADALCLFPGADKLVCNPVIFEIAGYSAAHVLPVRVWGGVEARIRSDLLCLRIANSAPTQEKS